MRGEVDLKQKDTLAAEKDFGKAIEIDRYDADTWASRAILRLQQQRYKDAEADFDHAIRLSTGIQVFISTVLWPVTIRIT